jgi:glycosyltransferase involved in cell wall biosynthesis
LKRVLIITYHWPPSGGITVLRCLKIAKYLRAFGWEPVILTAENAAYQHLDFSNSLDIPDGIEILKVPILEPINAFKVLSGRKQNTPVQNITANSSKKKTFIDKLGMWIRGNFFIPDARFLWIKPSVSYLTTYLQKHPVDAIFTDGPPHTNTVIGLQIAKKFNIPWIADFQDPWTQVDYYTELYIGKRADRKHKQLEKAVFDTAQQITIASPTWKADLEAIGARNVDVLYYGFDEADFKEFKPIQNEAFTIVHAGLLGADRNPVTFLEVLGTLVQEAPQLKDKIKIVLAGEVDLSVQRCIEQNGLKALTTYCGMISRQEVYTFYAAASLLILPINQAANAKGRIPGKLFELLRTAKPILVFGPADGDVKQIVEQKQRGISVQYNDRQKLKNYLQKAIFEHEFENFDSNSSVSEFSNFELTQQVAKLLDGITT